MMARSMLFFAALAGVLWLGFSGEASAQSSQLRCFQLTNQFSPDEPAARLQDLRRQAENARCNDLVASIDTALRNTSSNNNNNNNGASANACGQANQLIDAILATNEETAIRRFRDTYRSSCPSAAQRAAAWLSGDRTLPALQPWYEPVRQSITRDTAPIGEIHYDQFRLRLPRGHGVSITMRSEELPPLIAVGSGSLPDSFGQLDYAEASSDNPNQAVLNFVAPGYGEEGPSDYVVVFASADSRVGAYEFEVTPYAPPAPPTPQLITFDQAQSGTLRENGPRLYNESGQTYDLWRFQATAGQRVRVSMQSEDFDSFLVLGRMQDGQFEEIERNDDGGGYPNALIVRRLEDAGEYVVRAQGYNRLSYGTYQLSVTSPAIANPRPVRAQIRDAQIIRGSLTDASPSDDAFNYYQDFQFRARRGTRYSVAAYSESFSPLLDLGESQGDQIQLLDAVRYDDNVGNYNRVPNRVEFAADRGSYVLRVRAVGAVTGDFQIVISELDDDQWQAAMEARRVAQEQAAAAAAAYAEPPAEAPPDPAAAPPEQ